MQVAVAANAIMRQLAKTGILDLGLIPGTMRLPACPSGDGAVMRFPIAIDAPAQISFSLGHRTPRPNRRIPVQKQMGATQLFRAPPSRLRAKTSVAVH